MKCNRCGREFLAAEDLDNPPKLCTLCIAEPSEAAASANPVATADAPPVTIVRPTHQLHIKFKGAAPASPARPLVAPLPKQPDDAPAPVAPPLPLPAESLATDAAPTTDPADTSHLSTNPIKYRLRPAKFEASAEQIAAADAIVRHRRHRRRLAKTIILLLLALLAAVLAAVAYLRNHTPPSPPRSATQLAEPAQAANPTTLTVIIDNRANQAIIVKVGNQLTSLQTGEQRTLPLRFGAYDVSWTTVIDGDTIWDTRTNEALDRDQLWIFTTDLSGPTPRLRRATASPATHSVD